MPIVRGSGNQDIKAKKQETIKKARRLVRCASAASATSHRPSSPAPTHKSDILVQSVVDIAITHTDNMPVHPSFSLQTCETGPTREAMGGSSSPCSQHDTLRHPRPFELWFPRLFTRSSLILTYTLYKPSSNHQVFSLQHAKPALLGSLRRTRLSS